MQNHLTQLIVEKLNSHKEALKTQFNQQHPIKIARHFVLDGLLPAEIAESIHASFPAAKQMRLLHSRGEMKLKFKFIKQTASLIQDIHFAIQDPQVVTLVEEITGIKKQIPDPASHAGGVSMLLKGHYINPHIDNSHDMKGNVYRTVNLLYYVSPNWKLENGGNYELWDEAVTQRIIVPSLFNRLVVMETNRTSWHAVNPVTCREPRRCVFNYFFSEESPEGIEYKHDQGLLFFGRFLKQGPNINSGACCQMLKII